MRVVGSLQGTVVFYYCSASEIGSNKSGCLWWEWSYRRVTTILKEYTYSLKALISCMEPL